MGTIISQATATELFSGYRKDFPWLPPEICAIIDRYLGIDTLKTHKGMTAPTIARIKHYIVAPEHGFGFCPVMNYDGMWHRIVLYTLPYFQVASLNREIRNGPIEMEDTEYFRLVKSRLIHHSLKF